MVTYTAEHFDHERDLRKHDWRPAELREFARHIAAIARDPLIDLPEAAIVIYDAMLRVRG